MNCHHERSEPVTLSTGEIVARLCVSCGEQLHPGFGCRDCEWSEEVLRTGAGKVVQTLHVLHRPCPRHQDVI